MTVRVVPSVRFVLTVLLLGLLTACAAAGPTPAVLPVPSAGPETVDAESADPAGRPEGQLTTFSFDPAATEARFVIGEILANQPNTVVGVNDQVTGEIQVDASDPAASRIGTITVDASGFVTDSNLRNRAIKQFVLESDRFPVITFTPTAISGLSGEIAVGQSLALQITGDLTIRDLTQSVTFVATLTVVSPSEISGSAAATISRSDFELTIPSVPRVAGVDEQLTLELDFVARSG